MIYIKKKELIYTIYTYFAILYIQQAMESGTIAQEDAVEGVLGKSESDFRDRIGWTDEDGPLSDGYDDIIGSMMEREKRKKRYSIFKEHDFESEMLSVVKTKANPVRSKKSHFYILFHNPRKDEQTDVRGLMENENFNGAAFQFASTMFGPLEGGKFPYAARLETLHKRAVQGEFASISTIGATLWRKYVLPYEMKTLLRTDDQQILNRSMYTLEHFTSSKPKDNRLPYISFGGTSFAINRNGVKKYVKKDGDEDLVKIPIHKDVKVHYGHGTGDTPRKLRRGDSRLTDLRGKNQLVTCILSSTISLRKYNTKGRINAEPLQEMLQMAAYEGAIFGAAASGCTKVVLTLVGGGSFRNKATIIFGSLLNVLQDPAVTKLGIDIYLNFRTDDRWFKYYRENEKGHPNHKIQEKKDCKGR